MTASEAIERAHATCGCGGTRSFYPTRYTSKKPCLDKCHAAIDAAIVAAYDAGGHDEAHGFKRPKWLPTRKEGE